MIESWLPFNAWLGVFAFVLGIAPLIAAGLIASAVGTIGGGLNSIFGPKFPLDIEDINRLIDLQMNAALSQNATDSRRRLSAAGLGGSGVVNQIISDNAARIRNMFEERRQQAIQQVSQARYGAALQGQENRGKFFSGLAGLGGSLMGLQNAGQMQNLFQGQLNQLKSLRAAQPGLSPSASFNTGGSAPGVQLPARGYDPYSTYA